MQSYLQSYALNLLSIILLYTQFILIFSKYEIVVQYFRFLLNVKNDLTVSKNSIYKNSYRFDQNSKKY